jgi:hypothetical protein
MGNGIAHYYCAQKFYFKRDWGMGKLNGEINLVKFK